MENIVNVYNQYITDLHTALSNLGRDELAQAAELLDSAYGKDTTVYVAGNGGSAATASHMAADFCKTILGKKPLEVKTRLRTVALSDNMPLITAYGNDVSFDVIFGEQLLTLAKSGDVLVVISASGNSPNIVYALDVAKKIGVKTIGLLGFTGGKCKDLVDVAIVVPSNDYGVVEDAHAVLMHALTAHMKGLVTG